MFGNNKIVRKEKNKNFHWKRSDSFPNKNSSTIKSLLFAEFSQSFPSYVPSSLVIDKQSLSTHKDSRDLEYTLNSEQLPTMDDYGTALGNGRGGLGQRTRQKDN